LDRQREPREFVREILRGLFDVIRAEDDLLLRSLQQQQTDAEAILGFHEFTPTVYVKLRDNISKFAYQCRHIVTSANVLFAASVIRDVLLTTLSPDLTQTFAETSGVPAASPTTNTTVHFLGMPHDRVLIRPENRDIFMLTQPEKVGCRVVYEGETPFSYRHGVTHDDGPPMLHFEFGHLLALHNAKAVSAGRWIEK
jgi:hypothetical protein